MCPVYLNRLHWSCLLGGNISSNSFVLQWCRVTWLVPRFRSPLHERSSFLTRQRVAKIILSFLSATINTSVVLNWAHTLHALPPRNRTTMTPGWVEEQLSSAYLFTRGADQSCLISQGIASLPVIQLQTCEKVQSRMRFAEYCLVR